MEFVWPLRRHAAVDPDVVADVPLVVRLAARRTIATTISARRRRRRARSIALIVTTLTKKNNVNVLCQPFVSMKICLVLIVLN